MAAQKISLLLLNPPPPSKLQLLTIPPSPPPPTNPFLHNKNHNFQNSKPNYPSPPSHLVFPSPSTIQRNPTSRIAKFHDPNKGKPWSHHTPLSPQAQLALRALIQPGFEISQIDQVLLNLFSFEKDGNNSNLSIEILGLIKSLGYYKKTEIALCVFNWVKKYGGQFDLLLSGSVLAVIINILGKEGRVLEASSLLNDFRDTGLDVNVYAYTSMISACANIGRYREAVSFFSKMDEEGFTPTLITYNVILNVYGKMGTPWNKIVAIVDRMKRGGVDPDSYTYNTLINCCKRGSLYEEARKVFEEMRTAGYNPDKVTYNALLEDCLKAREVVATFKHNLIQAHNITKIQVDKGRTEDNLKYKIGCT